MTRRGFFGRLAVCGGAATLTPISTRAEPAIATIDTSTVAAPWACSPALQPGDCITVTGNQQCYTVIADVTDATVFSWPRNIPGPGGRFTWSLHG